MHTTPTEDSSLTDRREEVPHISTTPPRPAHRLLRGLHTWTSRLLLAGNVLALLFLWACVGSTWLPPQDYPILSLLGLFFPLAVGLNVAFLLAWLVVRYRWVWIPLVGMLPCIGFWWDYCPLNLRHAIPNRTLKVLTWNTHYMGASASDREEGKKQTIEYLKACDADIICLQESSPDKGLIAYMDSAGYKHDVYLGTILFTRFPILASDSIVYDTHRYKGVRGNGSKWYQLDCMGDTLLLVNNHLESNRLKEGVKNEYVASIEQPEYEKLTRSGRDMGSRLSSSAALRGPQTDSLVAFAERHADSPLILCGDFNDTPVSYTYQQLSRPLKNAYRESGRGFGFSYNQRGFWVRIDHIFVSRGCQTYRTYVDKRIGVSDHYPLVSWIKTR